MDGKRDSSLTENIHVMTHVEQSMRGEEIKVNRTQQKEGSTLEYHITKKNVT